MKNKTQPHTESKFRSIQTHLAWLNGYSNAFECMALTKCLEALSEDIDDIHRITDELYYGVDNLTNP
jgi:hypothetical protein